ncbi:MAG TPA: hypothetical protein VD969_26415 [Symbiobacteriaceae bacterium]|nr:hypothetical protein [Symbiobacteriaceae bacterium]
MATPGWVRLLLLVVAAGVIGFLAEATPGITVFQLQGNLGYIAVPRSLEGWQLTPGPGDVLVQGRTRLGLMELELEKTNVPIRDDLVPDNLTAYIAGRHSCLFQAHEGYQARLHGEYQPFGIHRVPTARAVYDAKLLGLPVRMVQHDAYWQLQSQYVRVGMRFPEFLDRYFWPDQYFIANYLNLAP